jgi:hypothetical protein
VGVLGVEVLSQPLKPRCPSDSTLNHTRVPDAKSDSAYLESNTTRTPELMYEDSIFLSEIRPFASYCILVGWIFQSKSGHKSWILSF